jgi:hypothetical protein
MTGMQKEDYQRVRLALLSTISDRAHELGEEIYVEAMDEIAAITAALAAALALAERRGEALRSIRAKAFEEDELAWHHGVLEPGKPGWFWSVADTALATPPPATEGNGMAAFAGAWPGTETEEELLATLDVLDGKGESPDSERESGRVIAARLPPG